MLPRRRVRVKRLSSLTPRIDSTVVTLSRARTSRAQVYLDEWHLDLPGDDTTVMVVDLNPSELPYKEPKPEEAGCCELM